MAGTPDSTESNASTVIELAEFLSGDAEAPVAGQRSMDCFTLSQLFSSAGHGAEIEGDVKKAAAYNLLSCVCGMTLKANEPTKPFGPLMAWATGSSPTPSTYRGRQSEIFGQLAIEVAHPALKARLADIAWLNTKQHASARLAIHSYIECFKLIVSKSAGMRGCKKEASDKRALELLRRAFILQRQIGQPDGSNPDLIKLARKARLGAQRLENISGFVRATNLELDFKTTKPIYLARAAEALASSKSITTNFEPEQLWRLAAQAYARADRTSDANRSLVEAAECLVADADRMAKSPMHETHWLEKAIATLRSVKGTTARRADLQARLVRAQGDIADFLSPMSLPLDVSDLVAATKLRLGSRDLADALLIYAVQGQSPPVADLRSQAEESLARSPFGSLFASVIYDENYQLASRTSASLAFGARVDETNIRTTIVQQERMRRSVQTLGSIEPGRCQIVFDHSPDEVVLTALAAMSPLVPPHHEAFFGRGFAHFFNADFIEAAHLLVPQLENSLRYILRAADKDTMRIKSDFTQSNATLSVLLDPRGEFRKPLDDLMGDAVVFEIENLFDHQAGPAVRHRMAHGTLPQWAFLGSDAIYVSWFIYKLCVVQLVPHAEEVRDRLRLV